MCEAWERQGRAAHSARPQHAYVPKQYIYSKYLGHIGNQAFKMIEIGLGCDMAYGAGASLAVSSTMPALVCAVFPADERTASMAAGATH